ncbi:hypothetical protein ABIC63_002080 [Pseudacidovorax sp. 1753]|uniref:hypothetical protein n=1 Tax=Pseudacidovorax sp. 1753 TaxID=3156419 RepID=UPI0033977D20
MTTQRQRRRKLNVDREFSIALSAILRIEAKAIGARMVESINEHNRKLLEQRLRPFTFSGAELRDIARCSIPSPQSEVAS